MRPVTIHIQLPKGKHKKSIFSSEMSGHAICNLSTAMQDILYLYLRQIHVLKANYFTLLLSY
jgi:hypothetical protein